MYTTSGDFQNYLQGLEDVPGVYQFLDAAGEVLYVGKSYQLRTRLAHYAKPQEVRPSIRPMLDEARDVRVIRTEDEQEALQVEYDLIQAHRPPYNTARKDDNRLFIEADPDSETFSLSEQRDRAGVRYFGPYQDRRTAHRMLDTLGLLFPGVAEERTPDPALIDDWTEPFERAKALLSGQTDDIKDELTERMDRASDERRYEVAAIYRDRLEAIESFEKRRPRLETTRNADVAVVRSDDERTVLVALVIRNNRLLRTVEVMRDQTVEPSPARFVAEFYEPRSVPGTILTTGLDEPEIDFLEKHLDAAVHQPGAGEKRRLVHNAERTAEEALRKARTTGRMTDTNHVGALMALPIQPRIIEGFDVSRDGDEAVGASVRFVDGEPEPDQYRRFKLGSVPGDPEAIRQTVRRRLDQADKKPGLVLVDGGADQVRATTGTWDGPVAGLAKADERVITPIVRSWTDKNHPGLRLLMRIRDEAHRFANEYAQVRRRSVFESDLQSIEGIGETLARRLIRHFGSARRVREAAVEKLMEVQGISEQKARRISR